MIDYLLFMIPSSGIEWLFFIVIFGLSVGNLVLLPFFAKDANWEDRWEAGTRGVGQEDDDFDIAHGSIFELSSAVATWPERCAEVLPSLLLVIGLLGTFLGVGFALDSASGVLGNKEGDPSKLISDMLPMLEGMGALFKSSIYGIICFLVFSLIRNALGFEKRRLTWCIKHCYDEIKSEKDSRKKMVETLENMSESIGSSLELRLSRVFKEVTANFSQTFESLNSSNERILVSTREVMGVASNVASSMNSLAAKAKQEFENMTKSVATICGKSENFADAVQSAIPMFQGAADAMSNGFKDLSANQIPKIVSQLQDGQEKQIQVLKNGNEELLKNAQMATQTQTFTLQEMNKAVASLDQHLSPILEQIKKSEKQIEKMNENVLNMQNVVNEALKKTNPDKAVGKIAEYFETMQKHMSQLQQNSLKELQNILAKLAVATKTAQRPNPTAAASSMPNSPAAQEQERKNIIEGLVRGVINPGINLGGKTNA